MFYLKSTNGIANLPLRRGRARFDLGAWREKRSFRIAPAMAAGIADHVWSVRKLLEA
jgi:hypothetical protein